MKRLQSIFKKEKNKPPLISRRTQLTSGEVWESQTATPHEQVISSSSIDFQEKLDEIINQRYLEHEKLKNLAEEEKQIVEEKKKIEKKKKKIEEAKKQIEEEEKIIEEEEKMLEEQEKNIEEAKRKIEEKKIMKKTEEENEED